MLEVLEVTDTGAASPLPSMDPSVDLAPLEPGMMDLADYDDLEGIYDIFAMPSSPKGWVYLAATAGGGYWAGGELAERRGVYGDDTRYRLGGAAAGLLVGLFVNSRWLNW